MRFETQIPVNHKIEPAKVDSINAMLADDAEDIQVKELRKRINEWKFRSMYPELSNRKNNKAISEKSNLARKLSYDLATRIIGNEGDPRFDTVATFILGPLGNPEQWTTSFTADVRNAISTDLYEYPMTFNTDLITTFKNRNYPMFE